MSEFRLLHVANGSSTTRLIEAAGTPGTRSIWADPLYEGPVPAGLTDAELVALRAAFLATPLAGPAIIQRGEDPLLDPENDLRLWRARIEDYDSYDELILWYEHDLFDQLNLIQLLSWIRERVPAEKIVSLICIDSFPGRPTFKGLGELTHPELNSLLASRRPVNQGQYALAARAWDAFRQPTPLALDEVRRSNTDALPFLAPALARFMQEYPWTTDGLSRSERAVLRLADGGASLITLFGRIHEGETVYFMTDGSLAGLAVQLSRMVPPLLTLSFAGMDAHHPIRGTVTLTDTGRDVLNRTKDRVATCGIDRWLGGVHLHRGNIWRWDERPATIVRG